MLRIVLFLIISNTCLSQSLYNKNEVYKTSNERITSKYNITFKKSLYGLTFAKNTPKAIKTRLENYINSNQRLYKNLGAYNVEVIEVNSKYYIIDKRKRIEI